MKNLREELEKIINEPLVREKYGKCSHCSFKTKSYITHKNNSIARHIITNHPEVPDKLDKLLSLFKQQMKEERKEFSEKIDRYFDKEWTSSHFKTPSSIETAHKDLKVLLKKIEEL